MMQPSPSYCLWDFAGVDGLQVAKAWFGEAIDRLSPFQSLDTRLNNQPCAVLRLCENNFRIAWTGSDSLPLAVPTECQVWLKQFDWLGTIVLPDSTSPQLMAIATPKPPHRLPLPLHCAAPARIDGLSVLIWRRAIAGKPVLEVQTAQQHLHLIQEKLQQFRSATIPGQA